MSDTTDRAQVDLGLDSMTYEQLLAELESVTAQMAAGDIGIEAAAELYERAGRIHAAAAARLAKVQERIDKLAAATATPGDTTEPD